MEKVYKNISKKISQGGSMMIEAMAMLALIALVTPTLYKKSAERTTELQDINTATHVRTLTKALDNYVSANYQALLEGDLKTADTYELPLVKADGSLDDRIAPYLPYGYKFEDLKNFGTPKVALKKKENENEIAITTFVQFPKKADIGEMRSARIASMIGSNGGYVDGSSVAKGVGGVWELDSDGLTGLGFDTTKGSVVVASSEAINSATSGALENEKYLQRTKVENENERWRNTMSTDLYMGGTQKPDGGGMSEMNSILGVERLIIGATESDKEYDLVLDAASEKGGAAYLAGNFSALSDTFVVEGDTTNAELIFGADGSDNTIYADTSGLVKFLGDEVVLDSAAGTAEIGLNTFIDGTLDVTGTTNVATNVGSEFKAGPNGEYITANSGEVSLLNGNIKTVSGETPLTTVNTQLDVKGISNLEQTVKIGTGTIDPAQVENPILNVQGNAFVSGTLEVGEKVITSELDLLNLHAGGTDLGSEDRWLHATADGVKVTDITAGPNHGRERMLINSTHTILSSADGLSKLDLSDNDAILQAGESVEIYTEQTEGTVKLQDGALTLVNKPGYGVDNDVNINATNTIVNTGNFEIATGVDATRKEHFRVLTGDDNNITEILTKKADITSERLNISGNPLLQVQPDGYVNTAPSVVGIDKGQFVVTAGIDTYNADTGEAKWNDDAVQILRVDASSIDAKTDRDEGVNRGASVYIRRGAIELEQPEDISKSDADAGMGYIEASRFVSNAVGSGNEIETPVYAADNESSIYYDGAKTSIDRYMVNPAYTSVMHDIKLTTRGGARLSDILPDFINKGIYVVSNTYQDVLDVDNLTGTITNGQVGVKEAPDTLDITGKELSGTNQWASPFLGVVPAPQCPPGHARVITITPSGFMMANTGDVLRSTANNPYKGNTEQRFVLSNQAGANMNKLKDNVVISGTGGEETILKPNYEKVTIPSSSGSTTDASTIYALAYTEDYGAKLEPIYFQQSTWLKSKVIPQANGVKGSCSNNDKECGENFIGWSAIMGFLYHTNQYGDFIQYVTGKSDTGYYWNIFPVMTTTLEAYATVYCYFDRSNIYGSGNDATYVDQYDQLNDFRGGYKKEDDDNVDYIKRLNDPTLKYDNPW